MTLTRPRRYQLRKSSLRVLATGHPWIYRGQLSSAASVFRDGQWLALYDEANRVVGHGMYEAAGAIAVRVLERGARRPDAGWVAERVETALARRAPILDETDAFRAIHGENDGLPAVVVDVYRDTGVLLTYSAGADALGRLVACEVRRRLGLARMVWKPAQRRAAAAAATARAVFGDLPAEPVRFREGPLELVADPIDGQKSGAYLDLRGLRRFVLEQPLTGRRMLNLFSYSGATGVAAEHAGAAEVWNVDSSETALAASGAMPGQRPVVADVFEWLPRLGEEEKFDVVVADPPPMTSRMEQVERALGAYRRLYRSVAQHVAPGGLVIACCCTSRIDLPTFRSAVASGLGAEFRLRRRLPAEVDHPVAFPEADYLKILVYSRVGARDTTDPAR